MLTKKSTEVVLCDGTTINVRRMKWKAAREFLKKFGIVVAQLSNDGKLTVENAKEVFTGLIPKFPDILANSEELLAHLVIHSTGLTAPQLDELDSLDALKLVTASLAANYDEDLKGVFASFTQKFAGMVQRKAA